MKQKLLNHIDTISPSLISISDFIFDNPELGLEEYKASNTLCQFLLENGFKVEQGIGGLETSFKAIYENGIGGPSIGLLVEYDALDKLGHACGHHMQGPCLCGVAIALKETLKNQNYKLVIYGTPAEETVSGKITMLKNGCFKDIDVAFMIHGNPGTTVDIRSMALMKFKVIFSGISAHAAIRPEVGRSALDALLLSFQGIEFLREHVPEGTKMHYTVLDSGGAANSVPARAVGSFYIRTYNTPLLSSIADRFKKVIEGAAIMTETTSEIICEKEVKAKIPVISLNDLIMKNATELKVEDIVAPREKTGSTDFGNVMYEVPGTCLRMGFVPFGASSHSIEYVNAGKGAAANRAIILGAKIIATSCLELIEDKSLMEKVKDEFSRNKQNAIKNI